MPKVKTLLITVLVIAFALSLTGCGMLLSRRAEPELAASLDGELPGWLLLSHRSEETFAAEPNLKDPAEDEDEDDGVTAPSSDQVASTQPAPSSPPAQTEQPTAPSSSSEIKPGTMKYIQYNRLVGWVEEYKRMAARDNPDEASSRAQLQKAIEDLAKELEVSLKDLGVSFPASSGSGGSDWDSGFGGGSPSGFGDIFNKTD
jgi:hypothetical protein